MRPEDHPAERTAHLVGRRWAALVVHHLDGGPLRHGELLGHMCGISQKTLTERLRELEAHGAVERSREGGDAVLYALTPRGRDLARLLDELAEWGDQTLTPPVIAPPPPRRRTPGMPAPPSAAGPPRRRRRG